MEFIYETLLEHELEYDENKEDGQNVDMIDDVEENDYHDDYDDDTNRWMIMNNIMYQMMIQMKADEAMADEVNRGSDRLVIDDEINDIIEVKSDNLGDDDQREDDEVQPQIDEHYHNEVVNG